jgi:hypothetical protein
MKKKILSLLSVGLILLTVACTSVTAGDNTEKPQISVTGSGVVFVIPDLAYINVGVRSLGDSVSEALDENNAAAQAIKDMLIDKGVSEGDIQTSNLYVYPQNDYDYVGEGSRTYYSVENNVYVTVRDLENMGMILDAVAESGANSIYGINFDIEDDSEAKSSARKLAVESAKAQAVELAQAAGVQLGDLVSISSSYSSATPFYGYGMGGGAESAYLDSSVPISTGQIQVSAEVTLMYEFD